MNLVVTHGLIFLMKKEKPYSLRVKSVILMDTLNMLKVIDFLNPIQHKLLLENMLSLMKISQL